MQENGPLILLQAATRIGTCVFARAELAPPPGRAPTGNHRCGAVAASALHLLAVSCCGFAFTIDVLHQFTSVYTHSIATIHVHGRAS